MATGDEEFMQTLSGACIKKINTWWVLRYITAGFVKHYCETLSLVGPNVSFGSLLLLYVIRNVFRMERFPSNQQRASAGLFHYTGSLREHKVSSDSVCVCVCCGVPVCHKCLMLLRGLFFFCWCHTVMVEELMSNCRYILVSQHYEIRSCCWIHRDNITNCPDCWKESRALNLIWFSPIKLYLNNP